MKKFIIIILLVFFGISFDFSWKLSPKKYSTNSDHELVFNVNLGGIQPIFAASTDWDGVRGIARFTKEIVRGIDTTLVRLARPDIVNQTAILTAVDGNFTYRYTPNLNASVTSSIFGARTYRSSFEIWHGSGATATKALELYFDNPSDTAVGSGVLVIWQPNRFDSTLNSANRLIECAMTGGSINGTMVCSWNGPIEAVGVVRAARIKVTANASAGTINYRAIASPIITTACPGGNDDYYVTTFIARNAAPHYSTARWGFNDNSLASTICSFNNGTNNAYFNTNSNPNATDSTKFFVTDGITSDTNTFNTGGNLYPSVSSVNSLFTDITSGTDTDMTIARLNSLTIAFRSTAAP